MDTSASTLTAKSYRILFIATGLMLFALFFGAGNLIFPAQIGQHSGTNFIPATIGFLITGAGLPMLGVMAIAYSGAPDVQALGSRMHWLFGLCFAVLLYLSIGPLFAIPRTATVSFEIGMAPFFPEIMADAGKKSVALAVFSVLFFAFSYWLAMSPGKLITRIGKILTPLLLVCIAVLVIATIYNPMGAFQPAQGEYAAYPVAKGFVEGYNTMDALASLVFAIIVISALRNAGVASTQTVIKMSIGAGALAGIALGVVYAAIVYMGARSVETTGILDNGAAVLAAIAQYYWGMAGSILLLVIILLACISTSVGLIASCAEYFNRLIPRISYRGFAIIFSVVSCVLANKGLSGIIAFSIPMLMLLYPLTVVLILLTFLHKFFGRMRSVYIATLGLTLVIGILDAWKTAFGLPESIQAALDNYLPWYSIGLGWIVPAVVGLVIGWIYGKTAGSSTVD